MDDKQSLNAVSSHVDLISKLEENLKTLFASFLSFGVFMFVSFIRGFPQYVQIIATLGFSACIGVLTVTLWDFCRVRWFRLHQLAGDEKEILSAFIQNNKKTIHWFPGDDRPMSLAAEGIIFPAKNLANSPDGYAWYTIRTWIFNYLNDHRELINSPKIVS